MWAELRLRAGLPESEEWAGDRCADKLREVRPAARGSTTCARVVAMLKLEPGISDEIASDPTSMRQGIAVLAAVNIVCSLSFLADDPRHNPGFDHLDCNLRGVGLLVITALRKRSAALSGLVSGASVHHGSSSPW